MGCQQPGLPVPAVGDLNESARRLPRIHKFPTNAEFRYQIGHLRVDFPTAADSSIWRLRSEGRIDMMVIHHMGIGVAGPRTRSARPAQVNLALLRAFRR